MNAKSCGKHGLDEPDTLLLVYAASHEILPLRADDLLIDRLLKAVQMSLRHAKLHLISPLLALHSL